MKVRSFWSDQPKDREVTLSSSHLDLRASILLVKFVFGDKEGEDLP